MIINKVIEGISKLSNQVKFDLSNIHDACELIADERSYDMYLGKLERISENEVALVTKSGEKFTELCE